MSQLVESTATMIRDEIKANIASALASVRSSRTDAKVTTEPPTSYFLYAKARGYKTPAVFSFPEEQDFMREQRGANYISSVVRMQVGVLIEDRGEDNLTFKAWRYQAALHSILHQKRLQDDTRNVTLVSIVKKATFSGIYVEGRSPNAQETVFRKEVVLELDVEHWEQ